jgi:hypothetical protein
MVTPASRAAVESPRAPTTVSSKLHHSKALSLDFSALLTPRSGPRVPQLGPLAGNGPEVVEGAHPAPSGAIVPETVRGGFDRGASGTELDPLARSLAVPFGAPPLGMTPAIERSGTELPNPGAGVPDLAGLEEAVRRIAWGGDRRRGVARIELGGEQGGTTLEVRGEGREVSVRIELGRGRDAGSLPERIAERLRARGLSLADVEVR